MAPPAAPSGQPAAVAAAAAAARREKRAAAAAMAPRMQTQVQKWAKMTAELVGDDSSSSRVLETLGGEDEADGRKKKKKTGSKTKDALKAAKAQSLLRAAHRHDRAVSFGVGAGLGGEPGPAAASEALPPTCLLCLVRFATRQQLRDHEALSAHHRRQMRDSAARRAALQRYVHAVDAAGRKTSDGDETAETNERNETGETNETKEADERNETKKAKSTTRPPTHIRRVPRRRGDLAPVYTSYAVPVYVANPAAPDETPTLYHACLLCHRRFHRRAVLRLHERESTLHRARTRDPAAVAAAVAAVGTAAADASPDQEKEKQAPIRPLLRMRPAAPAATTQQYRDRARERRLAFGPSGRKKAAAATAAATTTTASAAATTGATPSTTPPAGAGASSKGAAMLGKMGWTAGLGLGAQGTGRTEAIAPAAYVPGVGLGASGGKLGDAADVAARRTESRYADFVEQTQEMARQRFLALAAAEEKEAQENKEEAEAGAGAGPAAAADDDVMNDG